MPRAERPNPSGCVARFSGCEAHWSPGYATFRTLRDLRPWGEHRWAAILKVRGGAAAGRGLSPARCGGGAARTRPRGSR